MFKNYLKITFRNLRKNKIYSLINVSGLAIGIACCILILLYVQYELSYDRYHKNSDRIYRVVEELNFGGKKSHLAITPAPFGPAMATDFEEVVHAVRLLSSKSIGGKVLVNYQENIFYEEKWFYADSNVLEIFSFPLVKGNPKTALKEPLSILITEKTAKKYFGDEDPLEKILAVVDKYKKNDFKITGILKNIPQNSHFTFDFLASFSTIEKHYNFNLPNWFNHMYYTYLLLDKGCNPRDLEGKFPDFIGKYTGPARDALKPHLQPLSSIHLHSHLEGEIEPNSDIVYVYVFSAIAFFILLIACINFMNLSTARSAPRAKEVGIRKVLGAYHVQLIKQFLGESILLSFIAFPIAVVLVELLLPAFSALADRELALSFFASWPVLFGLIGMTLLVGVVSGIYPAFFLSAFKPIKVLKGLMRTGGEGLFLRKGLIVFQFAVSITLIISTFIIKDQVHYIRTKNLGFKKEQVVVLPIRDREVRGRYEAMKNEFLQDHRIVNLTASSGLPGRIRHNWVIQAEGVRDSWPLRMEDVPRDRPRLSAWVLMVDHDFLKTLGMELIQGRDFSRGFATDEKEAVILNESAVKRFGWESPLGKNIKTENKDGTIIGVVKDFHFQSLRQLIEPVVIYISPNFFEYVSVRISSDNIPSILAFLKGKWKELAPNQPFEYFFLDSDFDSVYRSEERVGKILAGSTALAIFIACLGLFGLASFAAEQRTKEIGIRKVLGASVANIVSMLANEFVRWVLIANIIAWPVSYYAMSRWLQNFAYRTSIEPGAFLLAAFIALGIAILTVSFQSVRAALANPVDSLRYE